MWARSDAGRGCPRGRVGPGAHEAEEEVRLDGGRVPVEAAGRILDDVVRTRHLPPRVEVGRRHADVDPRVPAPRRVPLVVDGDLVGVPLGELAPGDRVSRQSEPSRW